MNEKKRIERELPVKLSHEQLDSKRDELADLVLDRTTLENDLRNHSAGERKKIKDLKSKAKEVATEIQSEAATMLVACEEEFSYSTNTVIVRRLDTKEKIEDRCMTEEERQEPLPIDAGKGRKKAQLGLVPKGEAPPGAH